MYKHGESSNYGFPQKMSPDVDNFVVNYIESVSQVFRKGKRLQVTVGGVKEGRRLFILS
jgi:hypothetical protein